MIRVEAQGVMSTLPHKGSTAVGKRKGHLPKPCRRCGGIGWADTITDVRLSRYSRGVLLFCMLISEYSVFTYARVSSLRKALFLACIKNI